MDVGLFENKRDTVISGHVEYLKADIFKGLSDSPF